MVVGVCGAFSAVIAALAVGFAVRTADVLDVQKVLGAPTPGCSFLTSEEMRAAEDLVTYREGILIGGAGDTVPCVERAPESFVSGFMFAVDARGGQPTVRKLEISGTPKVFGFHPHGIHYSRATERLYVVNHGGFSTVGTRVEVFAVKEGAEGLPHFEWVMAIGEGNRFPNLGLNSVVEASPTEVYISQWQNMGVAIAGKRNSNTIRDYISLVLQFVVELSAWRGFTGVHRCTFDIDARTTLNCDWAAYGFVHANGLALTQDKSMLYVSDPIRKTLFAFNRNASTGKLVAAPQLNIPVPHATDNVHLDEASGEFWVGTIGKVYQVLDHTKPIAGGLTVVHPPFKGSATRTSDQVMHDASLLSWISACAKVGVPGSPSKTWAVCGSPYSKGLLVCPVAP